MGNYGNNYENRYCDLYKNQSVYRSISFMLFILLVFPSICYSAVTLIFSWNIPQEMEKYLDGYVITSPKQDNDIVIDDPTARQKIIKVELKDGVNEFYIQAYRGKNRGEPSKVSSIVKIPKINNFEVKEKENE